MDAISDDGASGLSIIAMLGNVFSPYYYWAGRKDPLNHCALNIGLYTPRQKKWTMTERGRKAISRSPSTLVIGPSVLTWEDSVLTIDFDETTAPFPSRMRGRVRLVPSGITTRAYTLDTDGRHQWWPIAPCARVEVELQNPAMRWHGEGYFDANVGIEPLEAGFQRWNWSRASLRDGSAVLYDVTLRNGSRSSLALKFDRSGATESFLPPPAAALPPSPWRVGRATQADDGQAKVLRTLEDSPFYTRSLVQSRLLGEDVTAMHESLDLDRFSMPVVKVLLPFRMPRVWW